MGEIEIKLKRAKEENKYETQRKKVWKGEKKEGIWASIGGLLQRGCHRFSIGCMGLHDGEILGE